MLTHLVRKVRHALRDGISSKRSSHWAAARKAHLALFPTCAACGATKRLNVHHVRPFHLHPDLELDPTNFITLCMTLDCHLLVGHGNNFRAYNPDVRADAALVLASTDKAATLKEVAKTAKAKRLFE